MKFLQVFTALVLSIICVAIYASAINVYPLEADLSMTHRFEDVKVFNTGNDTAYVEISINRVKNPGLPSQSLIPLQDNPFQVGLIVTPNKMVIPVHQMRIARILYIGDPAKDNDVVYKVRIAPVSGQLIAIGNLDSKVAAGVDLIIAYSINVFVRPIKPILKLVLERKQNQLTIENTGNTNLLLGNCKQCTGSNCQQFTMSKRIYVGATVHYTLPVAMPVICEQLFEDHAATQVSSN